MQFAQVKETALMQDIGWIVEYGRDGGLGLHTLCIFEYHKWKDWKQDLSSSTFKLCGRFSVSKFPPHL